MVKLQETLFGVVYIMTEGVAHDTNSAILRKVYFLLMVDVLQVTRVMTSQEYGWTPATQEAISWCDIIYVITSLCTRVVPRWAFFILAVVLVSVAVGDTWYVARLFQSGAIQKMWPVKLLRFSVAGIVTILFSSVIKWLLIPIDCLVSKDRSLSSYFHGEGAPCTPWTMPEILITVPTLILAAIYIVFAMTTSYLAFEINPLSRQPRALYTGRVEALFAALKVSVTVLVYFSRYLTPITIATFFFLFSSFVSYKHLTVLPFHTGMTNNVRGGIYGLVVWLSFSTVIVSIVKVASGDTPPEWMQTLQWVLVGILPLQFVVGFMVTRAQQRSLHSSLQRLKGDWEMTKAGHDVDDFPKLRSMVNGGNSMSRMSAGGVTMSASAGGAPMSVHSLALSSYKGGAVARSVPPPKRTVFERFFDTEWEERRRFTSEHRAVAITRALLYERSPDDQVFLDYVIMKALEEHPESEDVQILNLLLLRFVNRNSTEATALERSLKHNALHLPFDYQYTLHVVERKSSQDAAASTKIGKGGGAISALNLMEFELGMDKARKCHVKCVSMLREFWRHAKKSRNHTENKTTLDEMLNILEKHEKALASAKQEYEVLLEKYPTSVTLLQSYAHFCDSVLNDSRLAEQKRAEARVLDGEGEDDGSNADDFGPRSRTSGSDDKQAQEEEAAERSTVNSESESHRVQVSRIIHTAVDMIMGKDVTAVNILIKRIRTAVLILILLASGGFALTDFYLFNDVALRNIDLINFAGLFRMRAISVVFHTRDMLIASYAGDGGKLQEIQDEVENSMVALRNQHWQNYENITSDVVHKFYSDNDKKMHIPMGDKWKEIDDNFWHLTNEFARRARRATTTKMEELKDPIWKLGTMSEAKSEIAYVHENVNRFILPLFERMVEIYEAEVFQFGNLTVALVWSNACLNAVLVLMMAYFVMKALFFVIQTMHYKYVICNLSIALPRDVAAKLYAFYDTLETELRIMDDEAAQNQAILNTADHDDGHGGRTRSSASVPARGQKEEGGDDDDDDDVHPTRALNIEETNQKVGDFLQGYGPGHVYEHHSAEISRTGSDSSHKSLPLTDANLARHLEVSDARAHGRSPPPPRYASSSPGGSSSPRQPSRGSKSLDGDSLGGGTGAADGSDGAGGISPPATASPARTPGKIEIAGDALASLIVEDPGAEASPGASPQKPVDEQGEDADADSDSEASGGAAGLAKVPLDPSAAPPRASVLRSPPPPGAARAPEVPALKKKVAREGSAAESDGSFASSRGRIRFSASSKALDVAPLEPHAEHEASGGGGTPRKRMGSPGAPRRRSGSPAAATHRVKRLAKLANEEEGDGVVPARTNEPVLSEEDERRLKPGKSETEILSTTKRQPKFSKTPRVVTSETLGVLRGMVAKRQAWYTHWIAYATMFFLVLACCFLSMGIPARHIKDVVNMAPTVNQAGRRRYLTSAIVHFVREMILADGFDRLSAEDNANAARYYLHELIKSDKAIRLGNGKHIGLGADYREKEHNEIVYGPGCKWRENQDDCTLAGWPDATKHGLQYLVTAFENTVDIVLARYDPAEHNSADEDLGFMENHGVDKLTPEFETVAFDTRRYDVLSQDREVAFILEVGQNDLPSGFGRLVNFFKDETKHVLETVHIELRLLFALYIVAIAVFFYYLVFRSTCNHALMQAVRAREFVLMMPCYCTSKDEAQHVVRFFQEKESQREGGGASEEARTAAATPAP